MPRLCQRGYLVDCSKAEDRHGGRKWREMPRERAAMFGNQDPKTMQTAVAVLQFLCTISDLMFGFCGRALGASPDFGRGHPMFLVEHGLHLKLAAERKTIFGWMFIDQHLHNITQPK